MSDGSYHHGDLPRALLQAAREIVAEEGVGAVSVRAVARRAGVSHAAPGHHFGDRAGLLAALATQGFSLFLESMDELVASFTDDATVADAYLRMGRAYIDFGLENPELYTVMFRPEMVDCEDPQLDAVGARAFGVVVAMSRAALAADVDDARILSAAMTSWACVHGFVSLAHDLPTMRADYIPLVTGMQEAVLRTLIDGHRADEAWVGDDRPATIVASDLTDPLVAVARPDAA